MGKHFSRFSFCLYFVGLPVKRYHPQPPQVHLESAPKHFVSADGWGRVLVLLSAEVKERLFLLSPVQVVYRPSVWSWTGFVNLKDGKVKKNNSSTQCIVHSGPFSCPVLWTPALGYSETFQQLWIKCLWLSLSWGERAIFLPHHPIQWHDQT